MLSEPEIVIAESKLVFPFTVIYISSCVEDGGGET